MRRQELVLKLQAVLLRRREALRHSLLGELNSLQAAAARSVGDAIDSAVDGEKDEMSSQLAAAGSRELGEVENALQRMREGRYGKCDECGGSIPAPRLQAIPYATLCIKCQRTAETAHRGGEPTMSPAGAWGSTEDADTGYSHHELN